MEVGGWFLIKAFGLLKAVNGRLRLAGCDFLTSFGELQGVGSPSPSSFELEPEHEPDPPNSLYSVKNKFQI